MHVSRVIVYTACPTIAAMHACMINGKQRISQNVQAIQDELDLRALLSIKELLCMH